MAKVKYFGLSVRFFTESAVGVIKIFQVICSAWVACLVVALIIHLYADDNALPDIEKLEQKTMTPGMTVMYVISASWAVFIVMFNTALLVVYAFDYKNFRRIHTKVALLSMLLGVIFCVHLTCSICKVFAMVELKNNMVRKMAKERVSDLEARTTRVMKILNAPIMSYSLQAGVVYWFQTLLQVLELMVVVSWLHFWGKRSKAWKRKRGKGDGESQTVKTASEDLLAGEAPRKSSIGIHQCCADKPLRKRSTVMSRLTQMTNPVNDPRGMMDFPAATSRDGTVTRELPRMSGTVTDGKFVGKQWKSVDSAPMEAAFAKPEPGTKAEQGSGKEARSKTIDLADLDQPGEEGKDTPTAPKLESRSKTIDVADLDESNRGKKAEVDEKRLSEPGPETKAEATEKVDAEPTEKDKTEEPGTETKVEPGTEVKEEPGAETTEEPGTEIKPEPGAETKVEPGTKTKGEPGVEIKVESEEEPKAEADEKAEVDPAAKGQTEPVKKEETDPAKKEETDPATGTKRKSSTKVKV